MKLCESMNKANLFPNQATQLVVLSKRKALLGRRSQLERNNREEKETLDYPKNRCMFCNVTIICTLLVV